jgi:DNA-binding GntR family transcriptional regulator
MPLTLTKHTLDRVPPHLPLRHQLAEHIRQAVTRGKLQPGEALPGEYVIAETAGISRDTVRDAIDLLVNDGILTKSNGRRTVVADPPQGNISIPANELRAAEDAASRRDEMVPEVVREFLSEYVARSENPS